MQTCVDIIGSSSQLSASSLDASALLSTSTFVSPRRAAMSQQDNVSVHCAASSLGAGGQAMALGAMSLVHVVGPVGAWAATGLGGHEPLTPLYLSCMAEVQAILNRQDKDEKIVQVADQLESLFTKMGLMYRMQIAPPPGRLGHPQPPWRGRQPKRSLHPHGAHRGDRVVMGQVLSCHLHRGSARRRHTLRVQ